MRDSKAQDEKVKKVRKVRQTDGYAAGCMSKRGKNNAKISEHTRELLVYTYFYPRVGAWRRHVGDDKLSTHQAENARRAKPPSLD